eukprot:GHVQ01029576.1.p1 GENE.GHVQ01029576.1~~GHVQ01029576.1.p1  ORF type:complete len:462 (-),score=67.99 GHVQ01029576.1:226-1404(-)
MKDIRITARRNSHTEWNTVKVPKGVAPVHIWVAIAPDGRRDEGGAVPLHIWFGGQESGVEQVEKEGNKSRRTSRMAWEGMWVPGGEGPLLVNFDFMRDASKGCHFRNIASSIPDVETFLSGYVPYEDTVKRVRSPPHPSPPPMPKMEQEMLLPNTTNTEHECIMANDYMYWTSVDTRHAMGPISVDVSRDTQTRNVSIPRVVPLHIWVAAVAADGSGDQGGSAPLHIWFGGPERQNNKRGYPWECLTSESFKEGNESNLVWRDVWMPRGEGSLTISFEYKPEEGSTYCSYWQKRLSMSDVGRFLNGYVSDDEATQRAKALPPPCPPPTRTRARSSVEGETDIYEGNATQTSGDDAADAAPAAKQVANVADGAPAAELSGMCVGDMTVGWVGG